MVIQLWKVLLIQSCSFLRNAPEPNLSAYHHILVEVERLFGVLDTRLQNMNYLVGDKFSIADIASFVAVDVAPVAGIERSHFPNVHRWWKAIGDRPAVHNGSCVPFPNPMVGAEYIRRLNEEPGFKAEEEEVFQTVKRAKEFGKH
jgi:hypothetical protein